MSTVYQQLKTDHENFEYVIEVMQRTLTAYEENYLSESGAVSELKLLLEGLSYFTEYPEYFHHRLEEIVLDYLLKHDVINAENYKHMLDLHEALEKQSAWLLQQFSVVDDYAVVPTAHVFVEFKNYLKGLAQHIKMENTLFLPILKDFDAERWQDVGFSPNSLKMRFSEQRALQKFERLVKDVQWVEEVA